MPWRFVGRREQLTRITALLESSTAGLIVITGDSGVGRSSVLHHVLNNSAGERDTVICLSPGGAAGKTPFDALRPNLPASFPASAEFADAVTEAAHALVEQANGRRLLVGVDDAHLIDHGTMLVLRTIVREGAGFLLLTRPNTAVTPGPDPTEVVAYENGLTTLGLPPLTVDDVATVLAHATDGQVGLPTVEALHAATGGNPRLLHDLLIVNGLVHQLVQRDGSLRLDEVNREQAAGTYDTRRVISGVREAWRLLAIDRVDELYRLALWLGVGGEATVEHCYSLMLRGRAKQASDLLDSMSTAEAEQDWRLVLLRAMCLAFGLQRPAEANALLVRVCARGHRSSDLMHAFRAWMLAASGQPEEATAALRDGFQGDPGSLLFRNSALAVIASSAGRTGAAVSQFRRALAIAERLRGDLPWVPPYLTACLIDALLMAGRCSEATGLAWNFHGRNPGSGWEIAVALSTLTGHRSGYNPREEMRVA